MREHPHFPTRFTPARVVPPGGSAPGHRRPDERQLTCVGTEYAPPAPRGRGQALLRCAQNSSHDSLPSWLSSRCLMSASATVSVTLKSPSWAMTLLYSEAVM